MLSSRKNRFAGLIICLLLSSYASILWAQAASAPQGPLSPSAPADETAVTSDDSQQDNSDAENTPSPGDNVNPSFEPYLGVITGSDVYIRSGPAQIYYAVGKLQSGQQIVVRGERHGRSNWAKIDPASGCFSYIAKEFVDINDISAKPETETATKTSPDETSAKSSATDAGAAPLAQADSSSPIQGIVTGDYVRVRAGSIKVPPLYARQVQTKLNKGTVVQIIGERDDFYKIVSPPGCYFWVALDFVKRLGPVPAEMANVAVTPDVSDVSLIEQQIPATDSEAQLTGSLLERKQYQAIFKLYKAEQDKPLKQRDYAPLKTKLKVLLTKLQSPSVKSSSLRLMDALERAEIAQKALARSLAQDERLNITLNNIDKKVEQLVAVRKPAGMTEQEITVEGVLEPSAVFTAPFKNRRFLVLDDSEDIIYYAVAGTDSLDLNAWVGKKVSLVGKPVFDPFGKTRILNVTGVIELPKEAGK